MSDTTKLVAEKRTDFGKGAARKIRRAHMIPAVMYGHGTDPVHLALPSLEFAAIVRNSGTNAVLTVTADGEEHLALTKQVVIHPLRNYIEHADLVVIHRGEKATVDVTVVLDGDPAPGAIVYQDASTLEVEADVMSIPESFEISVENAQVGLQILAGQVELPAGVTLQTDPEALVVNVTEARTEADLEDEIDTEGAGVVEAPSDEEIVEAREEAASGEDQPKSDD